MPHYMWSGQYSPRVKRVAVYSKFCAPDNLFTLGARTSGEDEKGAAKNRFDS